MLSIFNKHLIKSYSLSKFFDIYLSYKKSMLFLKGFYGIMVLKLPSYYFFIQKKFGFIYLIFLKKFFYLSFIKHFFSYYNHLFKIYCVRIRIRGLGYRIRKISNSLYYFFFNYTNMFYLHMPSDILVRWYKKRIIFLSNNFHKLKLIFSQILLLKKLGPYRLRGLRYPRQIILLKKTGKKI